MRFLGGKYKRRQLYYPKNLEGLRPTKNMAKEAMMSIISEFKGKKVLDLCCGTGALGLECISRGSDHVTCIDQDIRFALQNKTILDIEDQNKVDIIQRPLYRFLKQNLKSYDIIFLDPPWELHNLYELTLNHINTSSILTDHGILICESKKNMQLPNIGSLNLIKTYYYGHSKVSLIGKS